MISLIGQVLLAVGLAALAFFTLPHDVYLIVGAAIALVVFGLMIAVEGEHLAITAGYLVHVGLIALLFGGFWPALPIIVVWGGVKRRRAASLKARAESNKSSPSGPTSP